MKSFIALFVVAAITSFVNSQSTPPPTGPVMPPAQLALLQNLQKDVVAMQTSGNWDSRKIGTQLQTINTQIQPSVSAATPAIQDTFKQLQTKVQALVSGTPDTQAIKQTIHQCFSLIESVFPGSKQAISGMNPKTTPAPASG